MKPSFDKQPLTYLITSGEATADNLSVKSKEILDLTKAAIDAGVSLVQLREKALSFRDVFELGSQMVKLAGDSETFVMINGDTGIALATGADGVHLPADRELIDVARKNWGDGIIIGVSTHSAEEIKMARNAGADFVVFGPIFDSPGKGAPIGLEVLADVCRSFDPFPILGLGGIDQANFDQVLESGAKGIAAIRLFNDIKTLPEVAGKIKHYKRRNE